MTNVRRACLWVFYCLAASGSTGLAQTDPVKPEGLPPAHVSFVEGAVYVDRDGRSEPAVANLPLIDGDRLRTEQGRIEVVLPEGSLLHLDEDTTVDVLDVDLLRLLRGRLYVVVRGAQEPGLAARYQLDTPVASVQTEGPGEFRVSAVDGPGGMEVELAVVHGQATLVNDLGAQDVRAGERATVGEGLAPSDPQYFNSARWDAFDRWSSQRRVEGLGTVSVQYLPAELEVYANTFDRYGVWRDDPTDGAVWYPSVGVDWRPYSVGYWRSYPAWGSVWIGDDPWGWPTHHYGRWGFSDSFGWYWMPARVWGPAWVGWAVSPGYVSWCALGRHDNPVFAQFGLGGSYHGDHVDPWRGWTVVPRGRFGAGLPVRRTAVDGRHLDAGALGAFAVRRNGPAAGHAVPTGGGGRTSVPPSDRGFGRPGLVARPDPTAAARRLAAGRQAFPGAAVRRAFPTSQPSGAVGHRTEAPAATPDVTAFGTRRSPGFQPRAVPGASAAGGIPDSPPRPPLPRPYGTPVAAPSSANPYMRGHGGGIPDAAARPRGPERGITPQSAPPRPSSPAWQGTGPGSSSAPAGRRDSGSGMPAGQAPRGGVPPAASAPAAQPRYNPGSAAPHPRGGGNPPPRPPRGGDPD